MALKDYEASRGDVDYLKIAREAAMKAVVLGALDVKLSAAIIAVSAGYVYKTKASTLTFAVLVNRQVLWMHLPPSPSPIFRAATSFSQFGSQGFVYAFALAQF